LPRLGARTHIDLHHSFALDYVIGFRLDLLLEIRRRYARHVKAIASHIKFPAVINAAKPSFLIPAQKQRCATMRAPVIHHTNPALTVAKGNEFLAKQHQAKRRAVTCKF